MCKPWLYLHNANSGGVMSHGGQKKSVAHPREETLGLSCRNKRAGGFSMMRYSKKNMVCMHINTCMLPPGILWRPMPGC